MDVMLLIRKRTFLLQSLLMLNCPRYQLDAARRSVRFVNRNPGVPKRPVEPIALAAEDTFLQERVEAQVPGLLSTQRFVHCSQRASVFATFRRPPTLSASNILLANAARSLFSPSILREVWPLPESAKQKVQL